MLVTAIFNGGFRDEIYGPKMEELRAHQVSSIIGIIAFIAIIPFNFESYNLNPNVIKIFQKF